LFVDPKITWIIESYGGWIKVCDMETKDLDFMRIGFLKAYQSIKDGLPQKKLVGRFEWDNDSRGFLTKPYRPLVIGNREDVKMIEQ